MAEPDTQSPTRDLLWLRELHAYRGNTNREQQSTPMLATIERAENWLNVWAEMSQSSHGRIVRDARDLHARLRTLLPMIARACLADPDMDLTRFPKVQAQVTKILNEQKTRREQ